MDDIHSSRDNLSIEIDLNGSVPVYRQIANSIRARLAAGAPRPGDSLPPVRQLAIALSVHFNTVAEAYRILEEEGWVVSRRRLGTVVRERPPVSPSAGEQDLLLACFSRELLHLAAPYLAKGISPGVLAETASTTLSSEDRRNRL